MGERRDFDQQLSSLIASEAAAAHGDPDRMGDLIERLARGLGFTIAMACGGNAAGIDEMIAGAEGYAHAEAVEKSKLARFMAGVRATREGRE